MSYSPFGENTTKRNQTDVYTHNIDWILMPQRWCCGGTDLKKCIINSTVVFTRISFHFSILLLTGVGISLEGTEYSQTIFLCKKLSGLWRGKGGLSSLSGARKWGTWTMRHGDCWRFQLEIMKMFLLGPAITSPLCDIFWEMGAIQNFTWWEFHSWHGTSVILKPSIKCC